MSPAGQLIVEFSGVVELRRAPAGPSGLTLAGRAAGEQGEPAYLAFVCKAPPADLPEALENAVVHRLDTHRYHVAGSGREWVVSAQGIHLHHDVGAAFYRAVPPRRAPLTKRLFWRVVLGLAGSPIGHALLARRSRRSDAARG